MAVSTLPVTVFISLSSRKPSEADPPVPHQDPQSHGKKSSKTYTFLAVATAHQELPAPPELTPLHPSYSCRTRLTQNLSRSQQQTPQFRAFYGPDLQISCNFVIMKQQIMFFLYVPWCCNIFITPLFQMLLKLSKKNVSVWLYVSQMFALWFSKAPLSVFWSCVRSIFKFYSHMYISESEQQCLDLINLQDLFIHLFYLKLYFDPLLIHRQTEGWIYQSTNLRLGQYATYTLAPFTYGTKKIVMDCNQITLYHTHLYLLLVFFWFIAHFHLEKSPECLERGGKTLS